MLLLPRHSQTSLPRLTAYGIRILAAVTIALTASSAYAASITAHIVDASGRPITDVAVYAEPVAGQVAARTQATNEIEQKNRKFAPLLTVIQTGSEISFPNHDTVRHHVYSFSPVKMFELKLYSGVPSTPIIFDKPGTVVIGCNIHDQMLAYIHIVNTPYFTKSDAAGYAKIDGLPLGKYRLKAWHFNLPIGAPIAEQAINVTNGDITASFTLNLKPGAVAH